MSAQEYDAEMKKFIFLLGHRAGRDTSTMTDGELTALIEHGPACAVHGHQVHAARAERTRRTGS